MYSIGLDLAVKSCGLAIIDETKKIHLLTSYIGKEKEYLKGYVEIADWYFLK